MSVAIRPITLDDAPAFHDLLMQVAAEKVWILTVGSKPYADLEAFVQANLDAGNAHFVAVADGRLVGNAEIVRFRRETLTHTGSLGMALLPGYRGRGIGGLLLEATLEHAWNTGLTRIELEVFSDNAPALALYRKLGFIEEGVKRYGRLLEGSYQDIVMMAQYRP